MTEVLSIEVTFSLPDWIHKYDYIKWIRYDGSHRWAGQVKEKRCENEVSDYLWEQTPQWEELCNHFMGPWIKYSIEPESDDILTEIMKLQHNLHEALEGHFKSGNRKPHGNIY